MKKAESTVSVWQVITIVGMMIVLGILFGACESPESFHMQPLPADCKDQTVGEWYFSDCPDGHGSICVGSNAEQRASDCIFSANGFPVYCAEKCN